MRSTRSSTVDDIVSRSANRTPDRVALIFEGRRWTYRELDDAVSRTAALLLRLGLEHGARVAAFGRNSDAYLLGFLGCARAGLVHVPINYALFGDELAYLLEQSGASVVLVDPSLADTVATCGVSVPRTLMLRDDDGSLLAAACDGDVPAVEVRVEETDLVQLLYTSGTTARPKGAMMTHRAFVHHYMSCIEALSLRADDEPLHPMPLYHSAQMHVFLLPCLAVGATNHLMETPDIPEILRRVEADRIGALFLAPTVWVPLSLHEDFATRDLRSLRKAFYGASIMPQPVLRRLQNALPELGFYNCFGQSEIGPLATVLGPDEHADRPESCGRAVLFVEARVVSAEDGTDVPVGELGEVVYRSPQLCEGYWDKPEETADAFRDGWFRSGDLVRADAQGYITVVDRIKDVINTGGVLVASREVEDAIYTHPAVAEVAVIGTPDERWIEAVTAFVVVRSPVTPGEIVAHVKSTLAGYKIPKHVHLVDALPRNASGKVLKRLLRDSRA